MNYRTYSTDDREACLQIFRDNTPKFFGAEEEPEFDSFLERMPCPFFILEQDNNVIGCGGYFINEEKRTAGLCWGMVAGEHHKQGYGKYLLLKRLDEIARDPHVDRILMDTSQHSRGFFEKLGFVVHEIVENGYTAGLHRHELELRLDDDRRRSIAQALAQTEGKLT
jgi:N-acetylglutamate synthase-like GNAT family acetyltransferase